MIKIYSNESGEKFHSRGFSLIELLISISIMVFIMSVVLFYYGNFNDNLALSSASQELAIAIRQAQTYGINVRENQVSGGNFNSAYGVAFDVTDNTTNKTYYVFIDTNKDLKYTPGSGCGGSPTECIEKVTIRNGVKISSINSASGCPPLNAARTLQVTFLRPNPDASINFANSGGNIVCSSQQNGQIVLTSIKNRTLTVTIENTGQVSIQ